MNNLKAAFFLYSAVSIMIAVALLVPDTAIFLGTSMSTSGFVFALLSAAFFAVAYLFMVEGFNPLLNVTAVRLAIIWSALMMIASVYSIIAGYVTWGHVWFVVVINFIFFASFLIFYPRSKNET